MPGKKRKAIKRATALKRPRVSEKTTTNHPQKYKQWTEESMLGAIKAASEGIGINRTVIELPKTTLKYRISGRVQHGSKSGRVPYLSSSQEQELVDYALR